MTLSRALPVNPIIPGFAPDPSVVQVDGVFYLVNSSFHVFPGLPIYESRDLKTWNLIGHGLNRPDQLSLEYATTMHILLDTGKSMVATGGLFAPTIRHHRGTFYIVCTNTQLKPPCQTGCDNFIISTSDIYGNSWSDPVHFPFHGIDPDLFFDDDGRAYMQGSWQLDRTKQPTTTIKQYEIDIATGRPLSEPREIWSGHACYDTEGPHIYKRCGWYYLMVAEGGTFEHHMLSIARSRSVSGPYESFSANPILTADGTKEYIQNTGHGDLFADKEGRWWAAVLGVRNEPHSWGLGRETFLCPVDWPEGGWPTISQPKIPIVNGNGYDTNKNSILGLPSANPTSWMEYVYIRNVDLSQYKLHHPEHGEGHVVLVPSKNGLSTATGTFTFLAKRQRALTCNVSTMVDTTAACPGVKAGLAVYKDHMRHASIAYDASASECVFNVTNEASRLSRSTRRAIDNSKLGTLDFKIVATPARNTFFFSQNGTDNWQELGFYDTSELFAREMTGPLFGIFAQGDSRCEGVTFSGVEIHY